MPARLAPPTPRPPAAPAAPDGVLTVNLHTGAAEFGERQWDALLGPDGFYSSHRWIRSLELAHGPQPVLAATAGRLRGVLPTWTSSDSSTLFDLSEMTQQLIPSREVLWLGPRRATAATITCTRDTMRPRTLHALLEAARQLAARRRLAGAVWPYLTGAHALEAAACHPLAQAVLCTADTYVPVPAGGMRALEAAVRSKDRRLWRREQEQFARSATVEWTPLTAELCTRIAPLLAATRAKYGDAGGSTLIHRTLRAQLDTGVADQAVVALARTRHDHVVRAAAVFYRHDSTLHGRYWGTDPTAPAGAYFALTIYQAIDWAARHGMRRLHLSVSATAAKTRRGAQVTPLALVHLPADADGRIDPASLRRHNLRTAQQWTHAGSDVWTRWNSPGM
ncbi:peptidogalycan biosysnthesis protein [Streptomyces europaeiscabiei]|uniref:peptidogalycan biosysnthesis protein n=1 Tax=Streptomyces europaeiscabiei TaxID=146819 RepID=UPI0038F660BB